MSNPKKLDQVAPEGKAATRIKTPISCLTCGKNVPACEVISCEKCACGKYCTSQCMKEHNNHTQYCAMICSLERIENDKRMKNEIFVKDSEKLPYKMKLKLVRLVGERPLIKMYLNGEEVQGLWDTGAMISLVNDSFYRKSSLVCKSIQLLNFLGAISC